MLVSCSVVFLCHVRIYSVRISLEPASELQGFTQKTLICLKQRKICPLTHKEKDIFARSLQMREPYSAVLHNPITNQSRTFKENPKFARMHVVPETQISNPCTWECLGALTVAAK